jgi:voltage-gated potassium channel
MFMDNKPKEMKDTSYELFIGALSVLSIVNLALYYLIPDENVYTVVLIIDLLLSAIFMADFLYRLFTCESKSDYVFRQMGWADFLASLPLPQFKILRIFRILRVYRLGREYGGSRMIKEFFSNRGQSALLTLVFIMVLILEFGGLLMLWVESKVPGANITTASDAVWYVYVTITTVGYGDQYPVSNAGRIIGTVIMTVGVGLFGTITAYLANAFIVPADDTASGEEIAQSADFLALTAQIEEISKMLASVEQTAVEIKARVADLESALQKGD